MQVITLVCDDTEVGKKHPGAAMAEKHIFSLDGVNYEIDLCSNHTSELAGMFAYYADAGRRVGGPGRRANARPANAAPGGPRTSADRRLAADKRAWALVNGWPDARRGRLPREAEAAYRDAHK